MNQNLTPLILFKKCIRHQPLFWLMVLSLFSFLTGFSQHQDHGLKSFEKETELIRDGEARAFGRFSGSQATQGVYSVASDNFDVRHYRCEWQVDPAVQYINGAITTEFIIRQTSDTIMFDISKALTVDSILYHGANILFHQTANDGLTVNFPSSINKGTIDSVTVFYQGIPDASGFGSFYQGTHSGVPVIWTLSEPFGARDWWPCKNGLNDKADSIDIIVTYPQQYVASSNGLVVGEQADAVNRVTHFRHRHSIASYLVAIAVTNYVMSSDTIQLKNKTYPLISYAYPELSAGFFGSEKAFFKDIFRNMINLFGEYPFADEKYGHTQFGWGGGMEHQTNSFISTTQSVLMAHEYAHQWFGDMVTCGSWQDIWLNEGFATYCGTALFPEYVAPDYYKPYLQSIFNSAVSQPNGSVFVPDTADVNRLFSSRLTYNKGAYVLHMLRGVLGDSTFFRGVRRYLNDPAISFGYARTADLRRNMELESGKDLSVFFQKWIYGEGYPDYHAEWTQNSNNWVKVKLNQTPSHPSVNFFEMPVTLNFKGQSEQLSFVVDHRFSGQEFWINVGFPVDTLMIDPDQWILSKIKTSTKIAETNISDNIKIYPNPVKVDLVISLVNPSDKKLQIQLFNAAGQNIYQQQVDTPGRDELFKIPFSHFPKGVYWLKINSEKKIKMVKKIVK